MWVRVLLAGRFPSSLFTKRKEEKKTTATPPLVCIIPPSTERALHTHETSRAFPSRPGASINTCGRRHLLIIPQTGAAKASAPQ